MPPFPDSVGGFVRSVGVGATVAFGGLTFAISFATLVFDGPGAPAGALSAGASFALFGGAATALVVAARSSLPAIAEVQDGPSAIFAAMAAAVYGAEGIDETAKLPTLEAAIACTTVATGATMRLLGKYELGNIVRLLPSPVTGGFLAGTGWVLVAGAFKVLSGGDALSVANAARFVGDASEQLVFVGLPGVALGGALAVGNRRIGKFWVVPAFLSGGVASYFGALRVFFGVAPEEALTRGYLLGPFPELAPSERRFGFFLDSSFPEVTTDASRGGLFGTSFDPLLAHPDVLFDKVRWDVVVEQAPGAAAVVGLSVLGVLLITSAAEVSTGRDGDANDELCAAGAANVLSGLGGGFVGYHSLSSTQIAHGMGSDSRVPGATCALAYVAAVVVGPAPLAYVPSALIGGLLLFIGSSFLYEWVVEGYGRLPRSEYAVVLLIVVTVATDGYIAGVAAGVLGAAAVFVRDYSKVPVVRSRLRLGQRGGVRSSAPRARREVAAIKRRGAATFGAKLQGFLFFATAYKVLEEIVRAHEDLQEKAREAREARREPVSGDDVDDDDANRQNELSGLSHVVLDFSAVVGVDGSAIAVFEKLERWARRENVALVLSDCARPELARVLDIALAGEATPTFAFVDRPSEANGASAGVFAEANREKKRSTTLAPNLIGLRERVGDGLVASDALGIVVQTTDLDAALRFTEQALLFAEADDVAARAASNGAVAETDDGSSGSIGDWMARDSGSFDDGDDDESALAAFDSAGGFSDDAFETFDAVCAAVCATSDEARAFRDAWRPVAFEADAVVCERGEVADRLYWIESAVVVVETGGRVVEDVTSSSEDAKSRGDVSADGATGTDETDESSMANAERASYGVSVTRDFMGAVGFYRRGGVGRVRFGRILVREPGSGYCLSAEALETLEASHPRLAVRLHKLLAGTLANQVVSRNKLITQFIK